MKNKSNNGGNHGGVRKPSQNLTSSHKEIFTSLWRKVWNTLKATAEGVEHTVALCYYLVGLIYYLSLAFIYFIHYEKTDKQTSLASQSASPITVVSQTGPLNYNLANLS